MGRTVSVSFWGAEVDDGQSNMLYAPARLLQKCIGSDEINRTNVRAGISKKMTSF